MLNSASVRLGLENSLLRTYMAHFDGRLPDPLRATFAREVCRLHGKRCATVLAEWRHDDPESAELQATIAWAQQNEALRAEFEGDKLSSLAGYFDADNFQNAPDTYASARRDKQERLDYTGPL